MKIVATKNAGAGFKRKVAISKDCSVAQTIEAACDGLSKNNLCKLLEDLKNKNMSKIEVSHIKDKIFYFKNKNKEGFVEIPEAITKLGLNIMVEYLAKNPKLCDSCSLFGKKDMCPKHIFA